MKKLTAIFLSLIMSISAWAATEVVNGIIWNYSISGGKAKINGTAVSGDVTIPSTLGGYPVTSIDSMAFMNCSGLTSIVIPEGVTSIGAWAFDGCSGLTSIVIPDSVTNIGIEAFEGCRGLTSIVIPDGVTSIGERVFRDCSGLTSIVIPDGVTSIGERAFEGCSSLTSIVIPDRVTSIGYSVFNGCSVLTKFIVGSNNPNYKSVNGLLLSMDGKALIAGINGDVVIPDSVTSIGNEAFNGCSGLTSVVIPDGVTSIGNSAFEGCSSLTSIVIPDSVTSIGDYAFKGCSSLTNIVIPDSVTSIGNDAFSGCSGLTSVVIPDSVTSIGSSAFRDCSSLTSIVIPDSVTSIGNYAFRDCSSLTSIVIPDSVTSIGNYAFYGCSSLTSIVIPDGVTSIGDYAFKGCSGLTSVVIPDSVTSIGGTAFEGCSSLTSIVIPDSVTSIGNYAFYGCSSLTSIVIPDSVTSIGYSAFCGCSSLTSIVIPDSVTSIGSSAFRNCSGLNEIIFKGDVPDGLNSSELNSSVPILFPQEFGDSWMQFVAINSNYNVAGLNIDYEEDYFLDVEIISAKMRENNPTIMDIKYKVISSNDFVNVRVLAFEDGERSFAKVIRPETFVDNTSNSVGDKVAANVEHTISWQVSSDWNIDLAKVKFEVLAKNVNDYILPLEFVTIPATKEKPAMQVSWNFIHIKHVENALYWLYASNDADLTLSNGALKSGSTTLMTDSTLNNNALTTTITFLFSKMGYNLLSGNNLTYARSATRKALPVADPSWSNSSKKYTQYYFKRYAVKIIQE